LSSAILAKRDLNVMATFSGQEALETLDKHRNVDVVILYQPGRD
jgi:CheY-like chemotaxis protein